MLRGIADHFSERIVGHTLTRETGGYGIGCYGQLVYSDPGSSGEWSIFQGRDTRETYNMIAAGLDALYELKKRNLPKLADCAVKNGVRVSADYEEGMADAVRILLGESAVNELSEKWCV